MHPTRSGGEGSRKVHDREYAALGLGRPSGVPEAHGGGCALWDSGGFGVNSACLTGNEHDRW